MASRKVFEMELPDGKTAILYGNDAGDNEIFIDGMWGLTYSSAGICKIHLYTTAPEANDRVERREVVTRLTMAALTLFAVRDFLIDNCKQLEERGFVQVASNVTDLKTQKKKSNKRNA